MLNKYWVLLFFLKFLIKLIHQVASILNSKKRVFSKPGEKPVVVQAAVINTIDWMAEITFISHSSEAGKSKVKVLADLESGKGWLPWFIGDHFPVCPPMASRPLAAMVREPSWPQLAPCPPWALLRGQS